ncbi:KTSC domain-containing protein [Solimonas marina]|uniref:KTSC domain-containing protein n=1 Tax=Solimonas marina TaxID=2714601 RepID=A0A969W6G7_9GAMM|nr:KTSC domain-containing protein [Solimonas marina]NKF21536.1 KTSC domain-containing protein [Solimonas marina]
MIRQPVTSSNLKSVGYDASAKVLEVEFTNGSVYQYDGVPSETYSALLGAESIGKAFGTLIRGKFTHRRMEQTQ